MTTWEGFYAGYMSSSDGQGFAMFVFSNGVIAGADPLGVEFDGHYETSEDGSILGRVSVRVPAGGTVIQGASAGPSGMTYDVPIAFPAGAFEADFVKLDTPLGPVNLRMKRLRGPGGER
jgi:hypothetical protein